MPAAGGVRSTAACVGAGASVIGGTGEAEDGADRLGEGLAPLLGLLDEELGEGEGDGSFVHPASARTAARARPNAAAVRCDRLFLSTAPV